MSIADLRREYAHSRLTEAGVDPDPLRQFARWFEEARVADVFEPTAMTLATATPDGRPSARMVLLKGYDELGFVFYTDYRSRKGIELAANPRGALCFWWREVERQVRITGPVSRTTFDESDAYFRSRPLGSRHAAWTSHQSSVIAGREALDEELRQVQSRFQNDEPDLPPHWGGFRVVPDEMEFWQGRENRLHDRIRYRRGSAGDWIRERLAP
jgi:pyridoxamine 5'-phosphate oxidase